MKPSRRKWLWRSICKLSAQLGFTGGLQYTVMYENAHFKAAIVRLPDHSYLCEYDAENDSWQRQNRFDNHNALRRAVIWAKLVALDVYGTYEKELFTSFEAFARSVTDNYAYFDGRPNDE